MELIIKPKPVGMANCIYNVYENEILIYKGVVNTTNLLWPKKVTLYGADGKEICYAKQENILNFIMECMPIINLFSFSSCPFIYYKDNENVGKVKNKYSYIYCTFNKEEYKLASPNINVKYIYNSKKQIGKTQRTKINKYFDSFFYRVMFNSNVSRELMIMLFIISEVIWEGDNLNYNTFEYTKKSTNKKYDDNWTPDE
ncbi:hypothetical protein [Clostridium sp. 'White wine YQ']|uniref:hypothetical protein n=1 Tax=Clostridium sp. 'White wine YQ' TaxID=3027474 RepID=UPI00236695B5|nr:hypothetical protein [Clostridium sp. 'White wine YQ']MDD7795082.1 hypothetical protein [Clostridium sp. 'White wine YQ']